MISTAKLQKTLYPLLWPFGLLYALLMRLRRYAYAKKIFKAYRPKVFTIAVGNIAAGGTGKTPLVDFLLRRASEAGLRAVVLTRGYKARSPKLPFLVKKDSSPWQAGDEPLMLARKNPQAFVVVDPKRSRAAKFAEQELGPDIFLLDDGLQHLALGRHKNIVLLRPEDIEADWNKVLPAGIWREDESALDAADVFLLRLPSRAANALASNQALLQQAALKLPQRPLFPFVFENYALRPVNLAAQQVLQKARSLPDEEKEPEALEFGPLAGTPVPDVGLTAKDDPFVSSEVGAADSYESIYLFSGLAAHLSGRPYVLLCAVGSPHRVREGAEQLLGYAPQHVYALPDHYPFGLHDVTTLNNLGLDVVCTEKDAVKLEALMSDPGDCPLWALQGRLYFLPLHGGGTGESFSEWLSSNLPNKAKV